MICKHCGTNIPDEKIEEIKQFTDKILCPKCKSDLLNAVEEAPYMEYIDALITEELPFPISLCIDRLVREVKENAPVIDRLISLKDLMELVIRYLAIIELSIDISRNTLSEEEVNELLGKLARPALGDWVEMLSMVSKNVRESFPKDIMEDELLSIYNILFEFHTRKKDGRHKQKEAMTMLWSFVEFRNNVLGHGAKRSNNEYEGLFLKWMTEFKKLLPIVELLYKFRLIYLTEDGEEIECCGTEYPLEHVSSKGKYYIDMGRYGSIELHPFMFSITCEVDGTGQLFFYDSNKSYWSSNSKVNVLEYQGGHKNPAEYPVPGLEQLFGKVKMKEVFKKIRFKVAEIDKNILHWEELVEKHCNITGREFLLEDLKEFFSSRKSGTYVLVSPPGMGKTAFSSYLVQNGEASVHFFYRRTTTFTSSDYFIKSVYYTLLKNYGLAEEEITSDFSELSVKLHNLLRDISENYLKENERCVILVDALDEGMESRGKVSPYNALPQELPGKVYVVATTRPVSNLDELKERENYVIKYLDPLSDENRKDAFSYLQNKFSSLPLEEKEMNSIIEAAEGNFLLVTLISDAILSGEIDAVDIKKSLKNIRSLESFYYSSWELLMQRCGESRKDINLINDVLAVLAAARAPIGEELVIGCLKISSGDWIWAIRQVRQFLDIISESGEVYYRIFHDTFRDYIISRNKSSLRDYHRKLAMYYFENDPLQIREPYGFTYVAYHLAAAGEKEKFLAFVRNAVVSRDENCVEMVIRTLDDLKNMNQLQGISKQMEEDAYPALLSYIRNNCGDEGRTLYFRYLTEGMPSFIAETAANLYKDSGTGWFRKINRLIDLAETIIKYLGIISVCISIKENGITPEVLDILGRPSLSGWLLLSKKILPDAKKFRLEGFNADTTKVAEDLVKWRNRFAHGATPDEEECKVAFYEMLEEVDFLINGFIILSEYKVVQIVEIKGSMAKLKIIQGTHKSGFKEEWTYWPYQYKNPNTTLLLSPDQAPLLLTPFVEEATNDLGKTEVLLWQSYRHGEIGFRNYYNGLYLVRKEKYFIKVMSGLETENIFMLLRNRGDKYKYENEFKILVNRYIESFNGRMHESQCIIDFINREKGAYCFITGVVGMGKTSLLAKLSTVLPDYNHKVISYFIRGGSATSQTNTFVDYINKSLDHVFSNYYPSRMCLEEKKWYLENKLSAVEDSLVILIDAIDEASEELKQYIFHKCYKNVKFIYTSRRCEFMDELYNSVDRESRMLLELGGLEASGVRAILYNYISKYKLTEEYVQAVVRYSQGNPLYITMLCKAIEQGVPNINKAENLPQSLIEIIELTNKAW